MFCLIPLIHTLSLSFVYLLFIFQNLTLTISMIASMPSNSRSKAPPDPRTARRLIYNATRDRLLRRARRDIFLKESQAPLILLDTSLQGFDTPACTTCGRNELCVSRGMVHLLRVCRGRPDSVYLDKGWDPVCLLDLVMLYVKSVYAYKIYASFLLCY